MTIDTVETMIIKKKIRPMVAIKGHVNKPLSPYQLPLLIELEEEEGQEEEEKEEVKKEIVDKKEVENRSCLKEHFYFKMCSISPCA